ncbi:MAG: replication initiator protein A [Nitrospirota bacterium]|nr:replication initiator protein A [Nitrospirota bacterium]
MPTDRLTAPSTQDISAPDFFQAEQVMLSVLLWDANRKRRTTAIREKSILRRVVDESGSIKTIKLKILAAGDEGFPNAGCDLDFHMAFQRLLHERRSAGQPITNPVRVTGAEMLKLRGLTRAGSFYHDFKKYLRIMTLTGISMDQSSSGKKQKEIVWHVFDAVVQEGERRVDGTVASTHEVYLSQWFRDSLGAGRYLLLDYTLFSRLTRPLSKVLHQALHHLFHMGGGRTDLSYLELVENAQAGKFTALSRVRQQLDPCHRELQRVGLLDGWWYEPMGEKDFRIHYVAGTQWWASYQALQDDRIQRAIEAVDGDPPPVVRDVLDDRPTVDAMSTGTSPAVTRAIHQSLIEEIYRFLGRREGSYYPFWLQAVRDLDRTAIYKAMGEVQERAVRGELKKPKAAYFIWSLKLAARKRGLLWGGSSKDEV